MPRRERIILRRIDKKRYRFVYAEWSFSCKKIFKYQVAYQAAARKSAGKPDTCFSVLFCGNADNCRSYPYKSGVSEKCDHRHNGVHKSAGEIPLDKIKYFQINFCNYLHRITPYFYFAAGTAPAFSI